MFPILKGTNRVVTKGYYFPFIRYPFHSSVPFYIIGYRHNASIITLGQSDNFVFQTDMGIELHIPVPAYNLRASSSVSIRFKAPDGRTFDVDGAVVGPHKVAYVSQPGDFLVTGIWNYQVSVSFETGRLYHLNSGKFRVRPSIRR